MTLNTGIMLFVTNAFSPRRNYYTMRMDGRIDLFEPNRITHCVRVLGYTFQDPIIDHEACETLSNF